MINKLGCILKASATLVSAILNSLAYKNKLYLYYNSYVPPTCEFPILSDGILDGVFTMSWITSAPEEIFCPKKV
jgi:hypothetical protein